jgi:hypothetical protein
MIEASLKELLLTALMVEDGSLFVLKYSMSLEVYWVSLSAAEEQWSGLSPLFGSPWIPLPKPIAFF